MSAEYLYIKPQRPHELRISDAYRLDQANMESNKTKIYSSAQYYKDPEAARNASRWRNSL